VAKVTGARRAAALLGVREEEVAKLVRTAKRNAKTPDAGVTPAV